MLTTVTVCCAVLWPHLVLLLLMLLQTFMEKVVEECSSDTDFVWIHDYHLLVLPSLLRKRFNKIRCGQRHAWCGRWVVQRCHDVVLLLFVSP